MGEGAEFARGLDDTERQCKLSLPIRNHLLQMINLCCSIPCRSRQHQRSQEMVRDISKVLMIIHGHQI
jgi:hypothetical protein